MMIKAAENIIIPSELSDKGFLHIRNSEGKNVNDLLDSLGEVIQKTEIRENLKSTRLLASNQPMGFHTDHYAAKYIAWFCNSQSSSGGESLLIDTKLILSSFSEGTLDLLKEISVNTHQVFYDDKISVPLLSVNELDQSHSIYYASWLLNIPACSQHKNAHKKLEAEINSAAPIKLLLSEGDVLIIDNHRMLHGREGFPSLSSRWLTRYWLK